MKMVYFGEELCERAPHLMGALLTEPGTQWVELPELVAALRRGEAIEIRQATETEMQRAEGAVALYEIGRQLGFTVSALLDGKEEKVKTGVVTEIRDALESALDIGEVPTDLLDKR